RGLGRRVFEWNPTVEGEESHDAERVDVGARVDALAGDLLRADVVDGSEQLAGRGERRGFGESRDAKVRDHRATGLRLEKNVLGLDVAVNDAVCMCVPEGT